MAVAGASGWRQAHATAWLIGVVLCALLATAVPVEASPPGLRVRAMSQNLYLGADLSRLLQGEPPAALLETIEQTDYPSRAEAIARTIGDADPDVIGLQEAFRITLFDGQGNTLLDVDYLEILLAALTAAGEPYAVSSSVTNADVTLPIDASAGVFGRVVDRDVIIHRTSTTSVSDPVSANYTTNFTVDLGGVPVEFTRGWTSVVATVRGRDVRFVNTHLEVSGAPCVTTEGLVVCQEVQADELVGELAGERLPTILVGDFNAQPGDVAYTAIDDAGYADTWTFRVPLDDEPGFTCCQSETLDDEASALDRRIDHIFVSEARLRQRFAVTTVLGDAEDERTSSGLWYADHGGPWASLLLRYAGRAVR